MVTKKPPKKIQLLLVDDEQDFADFVKLNLENTGKYEVRVELHGASALAVLKEYKPDLILLDIILGDMDGTQVAAQVKKDSKLKNIPIIFVSGIVDSGHPKSLADTYFGYPLLSKPVSTEELLKCIKENLKK
ncbi:MAG: response regulator [Candidatus Omnitrophota bacterium]